MASENSVEVIASGRYLRLMRWDNWEYAQRVDIGGIVGIVAVTDNDELVMVEQYRPAVGKRVIELPAGLVGDTSETKGEEFIQAAQRELLEETGYSASTMVPICEGPPSSGTTSEVISMFFAKGLEKVGEGGGDHSEDITVHVIPVADVPAWVERQRQNGLLIDLRIYTGLFFINCR